MGPPNPSEDAGAAGLDDRDARLAGSGGSPHRRHRACDPPGRTLPASSRGRATSSLARRGPPGKRALHRGDLCPSVTSRTASSIRSAWIPWPSRRSTASSMSSASPRPRPPPRPAPAECRADRRRRPREPSGAAARPISWPGSRPVSSCRSSPPRWRRGARRRACGWSARPRSSPGARAWRAPSAAWASPCERPRSWPSLLGVPTAEGFLPAPMRRQQPGQRLRGMFRALPHPALPLIVSRLRPARMVGPGPGSTRCHPRPARNGRVDSSVFHRGPWGNRAFHQRGLRCSLASWSGSPIDSRNAPPGSAAASAFEPAL